MTTPDKAVEVAAQELYAEARSTSDGFDLWPEWEDAPEVGRAAFRDEARAALKAAEPSIRAQAIRDAAESLAQKLHEPGGNWGTRTNDIGHLLALADLEESTP